MRNKTKAKQTSHIKPPMHKQRKTATEEATINDGIKKRRSVEKKNTDVGVDSFYSQKTPYYLLISKQNKKYKQKRDRKQVGSH